MPKMTGHRYFAEAMKGYDVSHLFYVNTIIPPAMNEIDKIGSVQRVVTHGEKAAAYMADGYARASNKVGVCLCQDIGSTNLAAGLRDPFMAGSPVIAISGGQNDMPRYRHAYQNAEDHAAWDGVTKANYSVDSAARFPDLLRQAFRDATTGAPGPVHLELRGNVGQMLDKEADYDLTVEQRYTRFPPFRPRAEDTDVKAALKALKEAAKPIIVVGGGAVKSLAGAEVVALRTNCRFRLPPVFTRVRWCPTIMRSAWACPAVTPAGVPTSQLLRRIWFSSLAVIPADKSPTAGRFLKSAHASYNSISTQTNWAVIIRTRCRCAVMPKPR